ncbi:hypothetical protein [Rhodobacter capsulatus]|uniref:hypothetical protein n=1 Tax=Rhodobacter capsulatus TaxID=1061 RepID=UPI0040267096
MFDDVGWPWPKHACTDDYQQSVRVKRVPSGHARVFATDPGRCSRSMTSTTSRTGAQPPARAAQPDDRLPVRVLVGKRRLAQGNIRLADFQDAPSIVVHEFERGAPIRLDFVCVRLGKVVRVKLRAAR